MVLRSLGQFEVKCICMWPAIDLDINTSLTVIHITWFAVKFNPLGLQGMKKKKTETGSNIDMVHD